MGSLRWHAIDPPTYLDYPNAELLFIASHADDIAHDAGDEIAHDLEKIADEGDVTDVPEDEMHKIEHSIQKSIYDMLKARGTKNVVEGEESLIEGTWV
jgi:fructose-1,6-bisphosphatase/inositol monophosphatase family enzyme